MSAPRLRSLTGQPVTAYPGRPARSGQPWTEEDYQQLVSLVRDGADEGAVAEALQRSPTTIIPRVRRLLPVEERRCAEDRVLVAAHEHLSDPAYDWRQIMLLSEPPRPVHQPPTVVRYGLEALTDDDLVTVTYALLCTYRDRDTRLLRDVATEVDRRQVVRRLVRRRADALLHRPGGSALGPHEAEDVAERWVLETPAWDEVGRGAGWAEGGAWGHLEDLGPSGRYR